MGQNFLKINIQFIIEILARTMTSKKKKKNLKPAFKATLVMPYIRQRGTRAVKFHSRLCRNKMKNLSDYSVEELMDVFMRYVHFEMLGKRRHLSLQKTFKKLLQYYEEWLESYLVANEKFKRRNYYLLYD